MNGKGEVHASTSEEGGIVVGGSQWVRSNINHAFKGKLEERNALVTLRGKLGMDRGVRTVLGVFCVATFGYVPLKAIFGSVRYEVPFYLGPLVLFCLLAFWYFIGKGDDAKIKRNLMNALRRTEGEDYS